MKEDEKEKERVIKNQERKPCGCVYTEFADGSKQIAPCVPCGIEAVAHHLGMASQAMAAVAMALRVAQAQASMKRIAGMSVIRPKI